MPPEAFALVIIDWLFQVHTSLIVYPKNRPVDVPVLNISKILLAIYSIGWGGGRGILGKCGQNSSLNLS